MVSVTLRHSLSASVEQFVTVCVVKEVQQSRLMTAYMAMRPLSLSCSIGDELKTKGPLHTVLMYNGMQPYLSVNEGRP